VAVVGVVVAGGRGESRRGQKIGLCFPTHTDFPSHFPSLSPSLHEHTQPLTPHISLSRLALCPFSSCLLPCCAQMGNATSIVSICKSAHPFARAVWCAARGAPPGQTPRALHPTLLPFTFLGKRIPHFPSPSRARSGPPPLVPAASSQSATS
jgi:hypothetical protein